MSQVILEMFIHYAFVNGRLFWKFCMVIATVPTNTRPQIANLYIGLMGKLFDLNFSLPQCQN